MPRYFAEVTITLKSGILDPQGQAVEQALHTLGYQQVRGVRIGKRVELCLEATGAKEAEAVLEELARRLLANPVLEDFTCRVVEDAR